MLQHKKTCFNPFAVWNSLFWVITFCAWLVMVAIVVHLQPVYVQWTVYVFLCLSGGGGYFVHLQPVCAMNCLCVVCFIGDGGNSVHLQPVCALNFLFEIEISWDRVTVETTPGKKEKLLFVACCCFLFFVCCLLSVVCCLLFAVCCLIWKLIKSKRTDSS